MDENNYTLQPWKRYSVSDNGVFAPKGSNPTFHTEYSSMASGMNPKHPFVLGYIMHDEMPGDELVRMRQIHIINIHEIEKIIKP
jgi:hypothetical protein